MSLQLMTENIFYKKISYYEIILCNALKTVFVIINKTNLNIIKMNIVIA